MTDATVVVNNVIMGVVPNSISIEDGTGEVTFRVQSSGGGSTQRVVAEDLSSRVAMVKFKVESTVDNVQFIRELKENISGIVVTITTVDGLSLTFTGAVLTNKYEIGIGKDAEIEMVFHSNPAI